MRRSSLPALISKPSGLLSVCECCEVFQQRSQSSSLLLIFRFIIINFYFPEMFQLRWWRRCRPWIYYFIAIKCLDLIILSYSTSCRHAMITHPRVCYKCCPGIIRWTCLRDITHMGIITGEEREQEPKQKLLWWTRAMGQHRWCPRLAIPTAMRNILPKEQPRQRLIVHKSTHHRAAITNSHPFTRNVTFPIPGASSFQ